MYKDNSIKGAWEAPNKRERDLSGRCSSFLGTKNTKIIIYFPYICLRETLDETLDPPLKRGDEHSRLSVFYESVPRGFSN